ncbi:MAG: hypothetical protein D6791_18080 [Chloroflexi bacterium]|nr:MAG: hypothetical protein D6791_18080 [Chloroflexota bacterium]
MRGLLRLKPLQIVVIASLLVLASIGLASAQNPAYQTPFITAITYQNVSSSTANVTFNFYAEGSGTPITITPDPLPAGAGAYLYVGGLAQIPSNFSGAAVLSADQPVVATLVQIPQSTTVKNRPLSNGFSSASSQVLIATVLKNKFNTTTKFSVQNAHSGPIDIKVQFFNADNPAAPPIELTATNIPSGSAKSYDLGQISELGSVFNGSAIVTATAAGTSTPANIVASALELSTTGVEAKAFEGVNGGAKTVYMPSALCNAFGGQTSYYAVQNTSSTQSTNVTVTYSNGNTDNASIGPGKKASFSGCNVNSANFSGSATITSDTTDIVVIGKVAGAGVSSAFLGETSGASKLALPYVRWSETGYDNGTRQRTFIAIQNVGSGTVNNIQVKYLNKNGEVVGIHTISSLAPGAKANSWATQATLQAGHTQNELNEFGTPEGNPGGGYGGAVIVEGPSGSQLAAVARVASKVGSSLVAEDYNGIPVQ